MADPSNETSRSGSPSTWPEVSSVSPTTHCVMQADNTEMPQPCVPEEVVVGISASAITRGPLSTWDMIALSAVWFGTSAVTDLMFFEAAPSQVRVARASTVLLESSQWLDLRSARLLAMRTRPSRFPLLCYSRPWLRSLCRPLWAYGPIALSPPMARDVPLWRWAPCSLPWA